LAPEITFFNIMDDIAKKHRKISYNYECKSSIGTMRDDHIIIEEQEEEKKEELPVKIYESVISE